MDHDAMLEAFAKRARRGKLAEFRAGALGQHGGDFSVEAAGNPFDHRLIGTFDGDAQNTTITLRLIRLKMMPAIFAAVIIVSPPNAQDDEVNILESIASTAPASTKMGKQTVPQYDIPVIHVTAQVANAIIALRCCEHSGRFEDFWEACSET